MHRCRGVCDWLWALSEQVLDGGAGEWAVCGALRAGPGTRPRRAVSAGGGRRPSTLRPPSVECWAQQRAERGRWGASELGGETWTRSPGGELSQSRRSAGPGEPASRRHTDGTASGPQGCVPSAASTAGRAGVRAPLPARRLSLSEPLRLPRPWRRGRSRAGAGAWGWAPAPAGSVGAGRVTLPPSCPAPRGERVRPVLPRRVPGASDDGPALQDPGRLPEPRPEGVGGGRPLLPGPLQPPAAERQGGGEGPGGVPRSCLRGGAVACGCAWTAPQGGGDSEGLTTLKPFPRKEMLMLASMLSALSSEGRAPRMPKRVTVGGV